MSTSAPWNDVILWNKSYQSKVHYSAVSSRWLTNAWKISRFLLKEHWHCISQTSFFFPPNTAVNKKLCCWMFLTILNQHQQTNSVLVVEIGREPTAYKNPFMKPPPKPPSSLIFGTPFHTNHRTWKRHRRSNVSTMAALALKVGHCWSVLIRKWWWWTHEPIFIDLCN